MIEVVASVEPAHRDHLDRHADQERRRQRQHRASHEASGQGREGGREVGADHVERAVRQVDQVHDAEDQRQAGGEQEQQQSKLQTVQALFDKEHHAGPWPASPPVIPEVEAQPRLSGTSCSESNPPEVPARTAARLWLASFRPG